VRILVDTQCWIWMSLTPERLSEVARAIVEAPEHELLLSAASVWEIAIKHAIGKLRLPEPPERFVPSRAATLRTASLDIAQAHALRVAVLPMHHRDPFDRLLIAQAQLEDLSILTADPVFGRYDLRVIGA
jgi:PIN domain nuclease of toxin-antitoxin system